MKHFPSTPLLEVKNLSVSISPKHGDSLLIIEDVSFYISQGQRIAIVGESGSGKTVTAMAIMQLLEDARYEGEILFQGANLLEKTEKELREIRGQQIAMTFQDSLSTLNPIMRIGDQITEALTIRGIQRSLAKEKALTILAELGFESPKEVYDFYPHQFSGGMRQRVMIAIALVAEPQILIADEPTTALDVRIQAQVMKLINTLAENKNLTVILISHDMGVVAGFADKVIVMYAGRIVEQGSVEDVFYHAHHPYTSALLNSIPTVNRDKGEILPSIRGTTPEPNSRPSGCVFQDRCNFAQNQCKVETPKFTNLSATHQYACFFPKRQEQI